MSRLFVVVSLLCASPGALAASGCSVAEPSFAGKLRPLIAAKLQAMHVPGAIVYVETRDQRPWAEAFGVADLKTKAPIDLRSHVPIGSITKTFTGTAILQLVDEGKLGLDDAVSKYRPEVPNGRHITIRQLLDMTSGLYSYNSNPTMNRAFDADPGRVWYPKDLLAIAFRHEPYFAPGQGWRYSNTNSILLGLIIEQLTGKSVAQVFQERIFDQLGMSGTKMPAFTDATIPAPYPHGYVYGTNVEINNALVAAMVGNKQEAQITVAPGTPPTDVTGANPSWAWTAGAMISTVYDLRIWARALATGQLLTAQTQRERLDWAPGSGPTGGTYGLHIEKMFGGAAGEFIGHQGGLPGYQAFMGYSLQKEGTIVVLTNLLDAPNTYVDDALPADEVAKLIAQEVFA